MARKRQKILILKKQNIINTNNNITLSNRMEKISNKLNLLNTKQVTDLKPTNFNSKIIPLEIEKISNKLLNLNDKIVSKFANKIILKNIKKIKLKDLFEMKKVIEKEISIKGNENNDSEISNEFI